MTEQRKKSTEFFSLYNNIQGRLYTYLMMIVHNGSVADDLLQETAAVMWEKFDQFHQGTNFSAWAICIARNMAFEFLRKNKKTKMLLGDDFYDQVSTVAEKASNDFYNRKDALDQCFQKLGSREQKLLRLRYQKDMPVKEISQITGQSASTVYKNMVKIFNLLKVCIQRTLTFMETA